MAQKKIVEYAIHNDDFIHERITQPTVTAEKYEFKPNLLILVQQNQFGGSATKDSVMHLNTFTEICDMMCIKDVNPDAVKLRLFPFTLRGMSARPRMSARDRHKLSDMGQTVMSPRWCVSTCTSRSTCQCLYVYHHYDL
jgi:hypothetical protein